MRYIALFHPVAYAVLPISPVLASLPKQHGLYTVPLMEKTLTAKTGRPSRPIAVQGRSPKSI